MTSTPQERAMARSVRRGIPVLFIIAGFFGLGAKPVDSVAGILSIGFGVALFINLRGARWLALGACYLSIIGGCLLPAILFLRDPFRSFVDPYSSTAFTNSFLSLVGLVVAGLGYKGLKYYRSDLGRVEYFSRANPQDAVPEPSYVVIVSAVVWIALLALGWAAGMSRPDWLLGGESRVARNSVAAERFIPRPGSARPSGSTSMPRPWMPPATNVVYFDVPRAAADLPDLVPLGLCVTAGRHDRVVKPMIAMAYTNNGTWDYENFHYTIAENGIVRPSPEYRWRMMPVSNRLSIATFMPDNELDVPQEGSASVTVTLDSDNRIEERDEANNTATYQVFRDSRSGHEGRAELPHCNSLRLRIK